MKSVMFMESCARPWANEAHGFHAVQPAKGGTDFASDGARNGNVGGIEIDVVGDQEFACAHGTSSGRGMQAGPAQIRTSRGFFSNRVAKTFKLTTPNIFEVGAIGPGGGRFVEVNGDAEAPPDLQSCLPREHHALLELDS